MKPAASLDTLSALVTGRTTDLLRDDMAARESELRERIGGKRTLVIGGAGSVGSATVRALSVFRPRTLHVVDPNENNLAELVRDLRSGLPDFSIPDFQTLPIDYGSPIMRRVLLESQPYDCVLNFAAVKHVRSEKTVPALLHMLDVNLIKGVRFLRWLSESESTSRYFCVSTDKAANPVSLMGASKRLMEHVALSGEVVSNPRMTSTSARFANVAFSDGSLLDSFLRRLQKRQPLAVPRQTKRYFITLREAGHICLLAALCGPHRHILIPRLDPACDLRDLESIARALLGHFGLKPRLYSDEAEAKINTQADWERGEYPLLITPLDTSGEKPHEEFVGDGEKRVDLGMSALQAVAYHPTQKEDLLRFLEKVEHLVEHPEIRVSKTDLVRWMSKVVPQLRHIETGKNLDERM